MSDSLTIDDDAGDDAGDDVSLLSMCKDSAYGKYSDYQFCVQRALDQASTFRDVAALTLNKRKDAGQRAAFCELKRWRRWRRVAGLSARD